MAVRTPVIHLCENGGLCTADCELREVCKKKRIPLLIYAVVIDYGEDRIYPDEYLNEIAILKQQLVDEARHQGGSHLMVGRQIISNLASI